MVNLGFGVEIENLHAALLREQQELLNKKIKEKEQLIEESRKMQARNRPPKPYLKPELIMSIISEGEGDLESRSSTVNELRPTYMVEESD